MLWYFHILLSFSETANANHTANYLTNKEAKAMYYTFIKHDGNLRTQEKFRKHEPQASVFYISQVFSNKRSVL